jgi:branched-chain amino acid transport system permease protein
VFHISYAGVFLVSAYGFYSANVLFGWPLWLALPAGLLLSVIAGLFLECCLYRPFYRRGASSGAVMVASMGVFIIIENLISLYFGSEVRMFIRGSATPIQIGPVTLTTIQLMQAGTGLAALITLTVLTKRLRAFKIIWAMGDEPTLIPALGIPINRYRIMVFALSSVLGGLPVCLIGLDVGVDPHMGMTYLLIAAVAVLAGGVDRYKGWLVGGFILAIMNAIVMWKISAKWMDLMTFSLLIAVLMLRPQGMFGLKKRLEESTG